jgi:hypothetical protein
MYFVFINHNEVFNRYVILVGMLGISICISKTITNIKILYIILVFMRFVDDLFDGIILVIFEYFDQHHPKTIQEYGIYQGRGD